VIEAMAAVGERWPDAVLVMPGNPTPHELQLRERARELGLEHRMIFPDYVSAADLEGLYALARCFVFASVSEGFGLPVLEAMRRGVPVACSRATSLPEVAGDAALYFDPLSVPDIGRALLALMEDQDLRADLIARGRERQARFTWAATARGTLDSYARAWAQKS
jgi:glycosyltransferase involved in cell wall biosynthesis